MGFESTPHRPACGRRKWVDFRSSWQRRRSAVLVHTAIIRAAARPNPKHRGSSDVPGGPWDPAAVAEADPTRAWATNAHFGAATTLADNRVRSITAARELVGLLH